MLENQHKTNLEYLDYSSDYRNNHDDGKVFSDSKS